MTTASPNGKSKLHTVHAVDDSDHGRFVAIVPDGDNAEETEVDVVAVPAIGAHPKRSWIPYLLQRPRERTKPLTVEELPSISSSGLDHLWSPKSNKTDSSEKPPPSPQDIDQDGRDTSHGPWPTSDLREEIPQARILLYDHKSLEEGDTLGILAEHLLRRLCQIRKAWGFSQDPQLKSRPVFFICHSTGGLVAKKALILANQRKIFETIACDCYGMTFIATPHQGSAYLSSKEFSPSVRVLMRLRSEIPDSLRKQFLFGNSNDELREMAEQFNQYSTDLLRINTYYETTDSDLAFIPGNDNIPRSYHVPIASVTSAIMDLEHELETPLPSDHVGSATFEGDDDAFDNFLSELKETVDTASQLCKVKDYNMDLESEVEIEVNGFFEDEASSVKLWTARSSLTRFLKIGPNALLEERLKKSQDAAKPKNAPADIPKGDKQKPMIALEDIKSKPQDRVQNMLKKTISRDKQSLQAPSPLVRSSSDSQLTRNQSSHQKPAMPSDVIRTNAVAVTSVNGPTASIKFDSQNHPKTERKGSMAPTDTGPHIPAMDRLKLTWVHVPYTHAGWVSPVLERCPKDDDISSHLDFLKAENWASNHNRGRHAAPHAKFVKSSFVEPNKGTGAETRGSESRFAIYLQYLHWDTYKRLIARRLVIKRRMKQGRARPTREDIKDSKSIEAKMIWKYLGAEPPFHCRRTLDQYGYPNLRSCEARDDDQMLWKRTKPKSTASVRSSNNTRPTAQNHHDRKASPPFAGPSAEGLRPSAQPEEENDETLQRKMEESEANTQEGNVLMVDQLWLWVLDEKTIVTFFPRKEAVSAEGKLYQQGDLHNDIYNDVNSGLESVPSVEDFAALIVQRAVTILLDRTAHRHLQILRIYEESLSILIERMTRSYKSFRKEGFSVRPDVYNRNKNGEPMTSEEKQARDNDVEKQSKEDFSSLLELRDIYDELHTIKKLFKEQRDTLLVMARHYIGESQSSTTLSRHNMTEPQTSTTNFTTLVREAFEAHQDNTSGLTCLYETAQSLDSFETQVSEMIESAESAEKAYGNLLDIKQKQANVDEARLSRSQIDATAAQGRSILVFTIFTIIFLPLSFFTSVFGMNVREWSDPNQPLAIHRIVNFIVPLSVGVIFIALTLAFSNTIRYCAVVTRKIFVGVVTDLYHLFCWPLARAYDLGHKTYIRTPVPEMLEWISNRYLRSKDTYYGKDHNVWDEYALPLFKSDRDVASEQYRVPSRRRSFFDMVRRELKKEKNR